MKRLATVLSLLPIALLVYTADGLCQRHSKSDSVPLPTTDMDPGILLHRQNIWTYRPDGDSPDIGRLDSLRRLMLNNGPHATPIPLRPTKPNAIPIPLRPTETYVVPLGNGKGRIVPVPPAPEAKTK